MSELLTIRLSSRPDQPVHWLVWSSEQNEVIASGQLNDMTQLDELTEYAAQRPVVALAPAQDMLLTQVAIPEGSGRQLSAVLPFLLEEELAQDIDHLHVHLLKREGDLAHVAVVEHSKIQAWLAALDDAGIEINKLVPDALCLPLFDQGYSAAQLDQQWLIRQSEAQGIAAEESWLASWLLAQHAPISVAAGVEETDGEDDERENSAEVDTSPQAVVIHHYTPKPEGMPCRWQAQTPELVMELLAKGAERSKLSILSGAYKPQSAWRRYIKPWRKVAIAAGLVLTAMIAEHVISVQHMEQQAQAYRTESERIFRQVLPNFRNIPTQSYLKRQMNAELSRLGGGGNQAGLLPWLAQLEPIFKKVPQIAFSNLKYDQNRGELRLQASAAEFQHFEQLRTLLAAEFTVQQGQLSKEGDRVNGAVVLRRKS
ncbi:type II secretion system protein GspL [Photobacterium jeanii]|uniref:type II secretion system protein GspL n=1 Tax=Photobacterium jeanii TaxID=858640 RepID=UPI000AC8F6A4|nr:type II secretion system protein GspL [Photobacterium jeanii]